MATAFGPEGCILIHMLAEIEPRVRVFNLDTGYQFAETLELRDRIAERYGIEVELVRPETTVAEYEAEHGGPLYVANPDQCCYDRKIVPLRRALVGLRRLDLGDPGRPVGAPGEGAGGGLGRQVRPGEDQPAVELDASATSGRSSWPTSVPYNPLHDQGYPSIGCWPCTQARGRRARTSGRAAGPARPRPSAACTRSTAASSETGRRQRDRRRGIGGPMKISAKAEYACLAVLALARQGPTTARCGSARSPRRTAIPERYLVQILLQLKGAGLVVSTRGASGGYRLARPAASISLGEVLAAIDGPDESPRDARRQAAPAAGPGRRLGARPRRRARRARPDLDRPARRRRPRPASGSSESRSGMSTNSLLRSKCQDLRSKGARPFLPTTSKPPDSEHPLRRHAGRPDRRAPSGPPR